MKEYDKNILDKLSSLFPREEVNHITIIPLFGGSGVCWNAVIFAWIYDNQLYVKGHPDYLAMFTELTMPPLSFNLGVTVKLLQYYQITPPLWRNKEKLVEIINMVIEYAYSTKVSQCRVKEERIKDLPNMTLSLERSLFRVGIINLDAFRHSGTFESYFKLKQYNKSLSKNVLYILHSALQGLHVATLTNEQKNAIKKEYNDFVASLRESPR